MRVATFNSAKSRARASNVNYDLFTVSMFLESPIRQSLPSRGVLGLSKGITRNGVLGALLTYRYYSMTERRYSVPLQEFHSTKVLATKDVPL